MTTDIIQIQNTELSEVQTVVADNPVTINLSRMANKRTRDVQRQALDTKAGMMSGGKVTRFEL